MNLQARLTISADKKLVGKKIITSLTDNMTPQLWSSFMPEVKLIKHKVDDDLISMSIYDSKYFTNFDPGNPFEKWAAVEVVRFENIPEGLESLKVKGGLYAVFHYKGLSTDSAVYDYLFNTWLLASKYELDDRPHFEVLGDKYNDADPDSEEDIWLPIRLRTLEST